MTISRTSRTGVQSRLRTFGIDLRKNRIFLLLLLPAVVYVLIFVVAVLVVSLETPNLLSSFSAVAATFNNIGPGLGIVGPSQNFAHFSPLVKIVLSFIMIMGRLEIFPMIILFAPNTWLKRF